MPNHTISDLTEYCSQHGINMVFSTATVSGTSVIKIRHGDVVDTFMDVDTAYAAAELVVDRAEGELAEYCRVHEIQVARTTTLTGCRYSLSNAHYRSQAESASLALVTAMQMVYRESSWTPVEIGRRYDLNMQTTSSNYGWHTVTDNWVPATNSYVTYASTNSFSGPIYTQSTEYNIAREMPMTTGTLDFDHSKKDIPPHVKALKLLRSCLTKEELREFESFKTITIRTRIGTFRVVMKPSTRIPQFNVLFKDRVLCAAIDEHNTSFPNPDHILAQILMIKGNPKEFVRKANKKPASEYGLYA